MCICDVRLTINAGRRVVQQHRGLSGLHLCKNMPLSLFIAELSVLETVLHRLAAPPGPHGC